MSDSTTELPKGWEWSTLKEVVSSITYGHTASATDAAVGPRFLRITDIQDGLVNWETVPYCICDDVEKYALKNGDIVIARTGATTGKNFLIGDLSEKSVFASYLIRLETLDDLSAEYLSKFMQTHHYWQQITTVSKGSAQPGANASILSELAIPVAPLAEQRRIVTKIEALQERSRKAREALAEVGALLEQFRQSLLATAFRGDLTADWRAANPNVEPASELLNRIRQERRQKWELSELAKYKAKRKQPPKDWQDKYQEPAPIDHSELPELPDGWCWTSFGEAFEVYVGATPSRKEPGFWNGNISWVSSGEVGFCRICETKERVTDLGLLNTSTSVHAPGTVLLGMIGEGKTRGQAAILDIPACHNQNSAAIRVAVI